MSSLPADPNKVAAACGLTAAPPPRVLLLTTARTYRAAAFLNAAQRLGLEAIQAIDTPPELAPRTQTTSLYLDFTDLDRSIAAIVAYQHDRPFGAIIPVDDSGVLLAAQAATALGLSHNAPQAAEAARDKYLMRTLLSQAGIPIPHFQLHYTNSEPASLIALPHHPVTLSPCHPVIPFPCVVKPLHLSGSRGVIRADNPNELTAAITRLSKLLHSPNPSSNPRPLTPFPFLIEQFIPGFEVALEGLLDNGRLHVLALFDKPDPLDGPFFEETLYVTPSRLLAATQQAIIECAAQAAAALGLRQGPLHAEVRINSDGPWLIEVAGRSIGGLCSRTLRFGTDASLEELILRQALGLDIASLSREKQAGGVMMIPIPQAGVLKRVEGVEAAKAVPGIEEVAITAKINYPLVPLPEGDSYLGFIFARGDTPDAVENALREAAAKLHFEVAPYWQLTMNNEQ